MRMRHGECKLARVRTAVSCHGDISIDKCGIVVPVKSTVLPGKTMISFFMNRCEFSEQ